MAAIFKGRLTFPAAELQRMISAEAEARYGIKVSPAQVWVGLTHQGADHSSVEAFIEVDQVALVR